MIGANQQWSSYSKRLGREERLKDKGTRRQGDKEISRSHKSHESHKSHFGLWKNLIRKTLISPAAWSFSRGGYSSASAPRSISRCAEAAGLKAARAPIWPRSGRSSSGRSRTT